MTKANSGVSGIQVKVIYCSGSDLLSSELFHTILRSITILHLYLLVI